MAGLRELFAELGFENARTLLQSGNVVFESRDLTGAPLERLLESAAKKRLAVETDFCVRTAKEWKAMVAANPFPRQAKSDPGHLVVMVLKHAPTTENVAALVGAISGREVVRAAGRHVYVVYPDGIGRSRLTIALIEKKLDTRATGRNWNTVLKLGAMVGA